MSITREQIEKSRRVALRIPREKIEKRDDEDRRAELQMLLTLIRRYPSKAKEYCCKLQDSVV